MDLTAETVRALVIAYGLKVLGAVAVAILLIGVWADGQLLRGIHRLMERRGADPTLAAFLGKVTYYLLLTLVLVAALTQLGIPTTSVIAVLGGAALALGLALQDSLSNLAAGVVLIWLRLYRVGDFVQISDATGYVREVGLFHTAHRTLDNKDVYIPNSDVLDGNITNYSKTELVRLELEYDIGYEDDLAIAKGLLEEIMAADERIAKEPRPVAAVKELGESGIKLVGRPYVHVPDMVPVTFAINEQVKLRFEAAGISFPFPQREVRLLNPNSN